jgi:hypothetical protein
MFLSYEFNNRELFKEEVEEVLIMSSISIVDPLLPRTVTSVSKISTNMYVKANDIECYL